LSIKKAEGRTDWWTMFLVVIISPNKKQYPVSVKLRFECTNNTAEHKACILDLEAALELKIR